MAGILKKLDILSYLLSPSPNSFRRKAPSHFVGYYKCWGIENKETPIRLIGGYNKKEEVSRFEIKTLDHTANHYFALAATIKFGLEGI